MTPRDGRPGSDRAILIGAILRFLAGQDVELLREIRGALEREIDAAGSEALDALKQRLVADDGWDYYSRDSLVQRIHHLLADRFLDRDSELAGAECLAQVGNAPLAIFSNHLSYADANVIEALLHRSGWAAIADRITALAGPKVFTNRERRFSSLCFGTIKVPQSADVSSEEAALNLREVARAARRAIDVARARLAAGDVLLLFGEGTRSRTGKMQPMLSGVSRYLSTPGVQVLPAGLIGSETLFPVAATTIRRARVTLRFGRPIAAEALLASAAHDRRLVVDAIGLAIAELVPPDNRGFYADASQVPGASHALLEATLAR
jgi:1-acyl-sn-glycerol-3-phosphate acyltransferase